MQKKVYPQSFKDEVVKFYMTNHTIAETIKKYGIAESTLFEWRKRYNEQHYLSTSTSPRLKNWRQKELHLSKIEQKLEMLGKCSCGVNASIDEKMSVITALEGRYSIHVLCEALNLPRGTYYNRKRKANNKTSYEKSDEDIADSERKMDLLTEMIRQTVMQNAFASVTEDEYRRRYNDLTERFRAEEEKHKRLIERRKRMVAESVAISGMLLELTELEAPPIEFDEKLWHAVVDRVTVYNDGRLVYSLKDGSEITVML